MAVASSQHYCFLANALTSLHKTKHRKLNSSVAFISGQYSSKNKEEQQDPDRRNDLKLAKLAVVTLAAGLLTLGSVDGASAAKTGGRIGGQAFRSAAPPRSASPRVNNSRTNIYIAPPVAPPLVGGYGYGYGVPFYGGWGWSPFSFFVPGPSVAIGVGGGFETLAFFLFLGAVAAVVRRFINGARDEDEDDY